MSPKRVQRVALYARLSVTTEESVSIQRQLDSGRKLAELRGWEVVAEFVDDGVSATKLKPEQRPGWRALLDSDARFDAVVCWKVDRLARRVLDFLNADQRLQERGAGIVAVEDPIDMTTPQGRAFATVLSVFAELEAASISARVAAARRTILEAGRRAGGRPPFGWVNVPNPDGPGMVLAQDPERIGYVAEAAAKVLAGESLYAVTRWLDASDAPRREHGNRKRSGWAEASVDSILRNPVLAGLTPYQPGRKPGEDPDPTALLRDADGLPVVDESVAILTTQERRRLIEILDSAKKPGSRPKEGQTPRLLSGLVKCATCDGTMHVSQTAGKYTSWRCGNRECARPASINLDQTEKAAAESLLATRGDWWHHRVEDISEDVTALADVEAAISDTLAEMARDDADIEALTSRLGHLKEIRSATRTLKPKRRWKIAGVTVQGAWETADSVPAKREILRQHVGAIVVQPGSKTRNRFDADRLRFEWIELVELAS